MPLSDLPVEDLVDLYENAPCGYVSIAPDGRIAKVNRTLAEWVGRAEDDLVGSPFNNVLSFGGKIAVETHLAPMLRLKGQVAEIALDLVGAYGSKIPVIVNATEKRGDDGEHVLTRMTLFKALDRRSYERNLLAAREAAEAETLAEHETATLREQFIAVLGHDLRNPLASLDAGVRLLHKEALGDRERFILDGMAKSVARASQLIDNVLDLARGRLGGGLVLTRDAKEPVSPVLEQVVAELQSIVPDRPISTIFAVDEPVYCDRQRIGQLASNLVANAVAHGAPGSAIQVEARTEGSDFVLSVTNSGETIPPDAREKLFQPFFRGGMRRTRQGLGLGLFIVSEIAKAHDGSIEVISSDGITSFIFSMPRHRYQPATI